MNRAELGSAFSILESSSLHAGWPEPELHGHSIVLAPAALPRTTVWPIETGETIPTDFSMLEAVGKVVSRRRTGASKGVGAALLGIGVRRITVVFKKPKGRSLSVTG